MGLYRYAACVEQDCQGWHDTHLNSSGRVTELSVTIRAVLGRWWNHHETIAIEALYYFAHFGEVKEWGRPDSTTPPSAILLDGVGFGPDSAILRWLPVQQICTAMVVQNCSLSDRDTVFGNRPGPTVRCRPDTRNLTIGQRAKVAARRRWTRSA